METATLKQELANVWDTLEDIEERTTHIGADTLVNVKTLQKHDQAILNSRRHTEDLENRSRRYSAEYRTESWIRCIPSCNIRIRGVPQSVTDEELKALVIKLFSEVLDDPGSPPINRRLLKPLTATLRDRNISYKWGFPFALVAQKGEWRIYILGASEDTSSAPTTPRPRRDFSPSRP
ncbi:hypothetical protein XELAEV_18028090mg [Xenopus laevis]|uniref:Uncharacterized protein n=1 Tax=Xenopus laevis TaxID=8355 RepID=A0A974HKL9_XENLA|nr:hypothetical protein XELAEV_18028090mg [Xenopus laevis]